MASVNKRRWTAPNGEEKEAWVLRYKDTKGKHRQETFARKKEADARRSIVEGELRGGMHIAKGAGKKLAAVADEWLSEVDDAVRRGAMRPRSAMNYENHARLYVVPEFGDRLIHEIEPLDVERWLRIMHNSGTLAASSVKARFAVLKLICDFAIRHKWAKVNPCSTVRRELRSARPARIRTFAVDEVRTLMKAVAVRPPGHSARATLQMQVIVLLAAICGLRKGEIFGLTEENVDLDRALLRVRASLDSAGNMLPPKTAAGIRDVLVPEPLLSLLGKWLEEYPPGGDLRLVFTTREGRPMCVQNFLRDRWLPLLKRAGLERSDDPFHFHALRHFAGSWMLHNGWSIPETSKALGHANPAITMGIYAHDLARKAQSLEAVNALSGALIGAPQLQIAAQELRTAA